MRASKAKLIALRSVRRPIGLMRKSQLGDDYPDMLFLGDGIEDSTFDAALVGTVEIPCKGTVACYDYEKCITCLTNTYDDDVEDKREAAIEWMEFNVVGAYVGANGPVFLHRLPDAE